MEVLTSQPQSIGVELSDIDLSTIDEEQVRLVRDLVYKHHLIAFRNQNISTQKYLEFARKIGRPQIYFQDNYHHPEHPEIFVSSNVLENGKKVGVSGTGRYWHTDCAFQPEPLSLTLLSPQILPTSIRETYYINMNQVYEELPSDLKAQVDGKYALHEAKWRYKMQACDVDRAAIDILNEVEKLAPPTTHPAVITHPISHLPALYISEGFTTGIVGLNHEENKQIIAKLFEFIHQDKYIRTHIWKEGDLLMWDNRMLIHKASSVPKGESSMSYRIGVYDDLPFYLSDRTNSN
jgi:taurine dioxygenase